MIFGIDLFRERAYRRYWISGFLANIGWMIYWVVSTWLMVEIDGRPEMVALVQTCLSIPVLFFAIPAGAVADLYGRRAVIILSQLLVLSGFCTVAILIWVGSLTPLSILALSAIIGLGRACLNPCWQSYTALIAPKNQLKQAVAFNSVGFNLARSIGPAVGGIMLAMSNPLIALLSTILTNLGLLLFARTMPEPTETLKSGSRILRLIADGFVYVSSNKRLLWIYFSAGLFNISAVIVLALLPLLAVELFDTGAMGYGFLLSLFGIGAIIGALLQSLFVSKVGYARYLRWTFRVFAIALFMLFLSEFPLVSELAIGICGACWLMVLSSLSASIQVISENEYRSRAQALFHVVIYGANGVGAFLWGVLAGETSLTVAFAIAGGVVLSSSYLVRIPDEK